MIRGVTLVLLVTLAGCTASDPEVVVPSPSVSPSAVEAAPEPSPSPSPTTASPSPSPKKTTPPPKPPHTPPPPGPISCTGSAPFDRPPAGGSTPAGTIKTTGSDTVALTFDDGPDPVNTPKILDLLRQCGVKATFCVNGVKAQQHPSIIRRIHNDGHSFCNHTWKHITQLGTYGPDRIRQDLTQTNDAIKAIVPGAKISYFRAPGGRWTPDYIAVCRELGMTPTHWDIDTRDWESNKWGTGPAMVNHIIGEVQDKTKPGSIVLMHDFQKPDTTTALRTLLPWLKARVKLIALPPGGLPSP